MLEVCALRHKGYVLVMTNLKELNSVKINFFTFNIIDLKWRYCCYFIL